MDKKVLKIECPKCNCAAHAEIRKRFKFIIYICPHCNSNVVYYKNKVANISDQLVETIRKNKRFRFYGNASFSSPQNVCEKSKITDDRITDLRILLETEKDFNKLLSKL